MNRKLKPGEKPPQFQEREDALATAIGILITLLAAGVIMWLAFALTEGIK
mgnify:CR=1 FL=1